MNDVSNINPLLGWRGKKELTKFVRVLVREDIMGVIVGIILVLGLIPAFIHAWVTNKGPINGLVEFCSKILICWMIAIVWPIYIGWMFLGFLILKIRER